MSFTPSDHRTIKADDVKDFLNHHEIVIAESEKYDKKIIYRPSTSNFCVYSRSQIIARTKYIIEAVNQYNSIVTPRLIHY